MGRPGFVLEVDDRTPPLLVPDGDRFRLERFPLGTRVIHAEWGKGLVQRYDGDRLVALFDTVGYKTLSVELVEERDLLRPVGGCAPLRGPAGP